MQLTWPLYVWTPDRTRESLAINLLSRVVQDDLIDTVRQKLGQSYAPIVKINLPRGGDQGSLTVRILTTPDAATRVQQETLAIVRQMATDGVTAEDLDRAREPLLEELSKERTNNSWWVSILDGSNRRPDKLETARQSTAEVQKMPLAEVNAAAKRWLSGQPYQVMVLPTVHP